MNKAQKKSLQHANVLGAGAAKRRKLPPKERVDPVMAEYTRGTLHSGSGHIVTSRAQALAIAMSEAKKIRRSKIKSEGY